MKKSPIKRYFTKDIDKLPDDYYSGSKLIDWKKVYNLFKWKFVDVNIIDYKTGKVLFEGRNLEFPDFYSQTACDIIAKMYFRKSGVYETEHEVSLKQVIHRMVNFWVTSMVDEGLIKDSKEQDIVYDELAYMMINQMWAPNSPQWFNTGLMHSYGIKGESNGLQYWDEYENCVKECKDAYTRTQASACFIVGIEDELIGEKSLMDNLTTASRLFKYGSGIGSNWSKIRAAGESLSSGGKSSGLLSFQKVFDRNAGAIKSGGTTRRAAVMQILDIDHPEILDFIQWKSKEEDKVNALGKMGYDVSIAGEAYETVSGQNVNNSVSIPDSFMEKIAGFDTDPMWNLTGRKDHSVDRSIDAHYIWDEIAKAAWNCGDPGVQFSGTINKWNTCPNSGRIHGSNPCFTGDMQLLTANGYIPIGELDGQKVDIVNKNGDISHGKVWCSGEKDTIVLRLSTNETIQCTPDHIFMTSINLKNHKLKPYSIQNNNEMFNKRFMRLGFLQGDGSIQRISDQYKNHHGLEVYIGDKDDDIFELFDKNKDDPEYNDKTKSIYLAHDDGNNYEQDIIDLKFSLNVLPNREFPETYDDWSYKDKASFLRGCFSANGCVVKRTRVSYKTTCKSFAEKLKDTLKLDFNIDSYITTNKEHDVKFKNGIYTCKESYDINIFRYSSIQKFSVTIGFIQQYKQDLLQKLLDYRVPKVIGIRAGEIKKVYDFEEPLTHWGVIEGYIVHNCSEYLFLDDTACNLASINILKFYDLQNKTFDLEGYKHAITLIQFVLESSIHWGAFPTKYIAENTYKFRTTGIGLTNMGALIMALGFPYDSDNARSIAAILCSIMTGQSYLTSTYMAKLVGPFSEYEINSEPMLKVIDMHAEAYNDLIKNINESYNLKSAISKLFNEKDMENIHNIWVDTKYYGRQYGYRNAQVSVLAPTGTIAFAMDCSSTSSEPFFSHKTYKKVVDGSYIEIVNNMIEYGLQSLGYNEKEIQAIIEYIMNGDGKIEGAPYIKEEDLAVFDTANKCGSGSRYISPQAHVEMVAAITPHISGGLSKTVNLPADATVEDIKNIYHLAWSLGCKCIALYRDGSKVMQPLNTTKEDVKNSSDLENMTYSELLAFAKDLLNNKNNTQNNSSVEYGKMPVRKKLPYEPKCIKNAVKMDGNTYHVQRSFYDDGKLGEIFVTVGKQGNTIKGLTETLCILISKCLQYGIPVEKISKILRNSEFQPNGIVRQHDYIKSASSIPDLISKFMDISAGNYQYCQVKPSLEELNNKQESHINNTEDYIADPLIEGERVYGRICAECGSNHIVKAGTCYYCQDCGTSSGCS